MRKKIVFLLIVFLVVSVNTLVFADVGSFESYDSGSSWDSGSDWSSSSWDSDYSWSSSWDDDDSYYDSNSSSIGSLLSFPSFFVVVVILAYIIIKNKTNSHGNYNKAVGTIHNIAEPQINQEIVENKIKMIDPLFNEEEFNQKAKMLFVKMQNAWTDRNWEEIRPFESDELFEQHKMQIDGYIRSNTINVMDRICVLYSKLYKFEQTGDKDILDVVIKARMSDYIIDATTKDVIKGDRTTERTKFYRLEFIRKTGVKTKQEESGINDTNCPNCGAPTKITSSGQCEYCKSIITNGDFGWVLNNLEPFTF